MKETMTEEISKFIANSTYNGKEKPLSVRTREIYGAQLRLLAEWLEEQDIPYRTLTIEQMAEYLAGKTWKDVTRHNAVCAARRFYLWKFGKKHPICSMRVYRGEAEPQRCWRREDIRKLFAYFDDTPKGIRDLAIFSLLVDTGIRASELAGLTIDRLDMIDWTLTVRVKGGKWETSAFFDFTAKTLQKWLDIRHEHANKGVKNVFVGIGGMKPGTGVTRDGLRAIFRKIGERSGIGLISPHDLRRTFATLASENGAPTRVVQAAGHWSDPKMVTRYTKKLSVKAMQPYSPSNTVVGIVRGKSHDL